MVECFFPHDNMKKKIVIIGAGAEQVYAYQLARKKGYYVIATDNNPKASAIKFSDFFIMASTRDAKQTLEAIKNYCNENGMIDGVMTIANDVPYTVALVANYFKLKGHSVESAILAHDKFLMKMAFKKHGVLCPDFWKVSNLGELKDLIEREEIERFVIKPVDGRGARGVLMVNKTDNLEWVFNESLSWSDENILIVERFIHGMQISSESYLINGKAYTPALSERNYSRLEEFSPYIIEDGGTIPAPIDDNLVHKINKIIECGAKSMGVTEGIVKGDIVIDDNGEPQIIELALRLSGGWFSSDQIIATSGVDLVGAVINQALDIKVTKEMLIPKFSRSTSVRYWFPKPGKIKSIKGEDEIKSLIGLLKYGFFRKVGDYQPVVKMHPDRFGYVIIEGSDRDESISRVENALSMLDVNIEEE
jgi:biotin carboxylase